MLFPSVEELMAAMRADAAGADDVLPSDFPSAGTMGFTIWLPGGSITHTVSAKAVDMANTCDYLKELMRKTSGRREIAKALKKGVPFHDGCELCLAAEVMLG